MSTCTHGLSLDVPCLKCALLAKRDETRDDCDDAIDAAIDAERARCRAIVLRHFANEWRGNAALAEINAGGVG